MPDYEDTIYMEVLTYPCRDCNTPRVGCHNCYHLGAYKSQPKKSDYIKTIKKQIAYMLSDERCAVWGMPTYAELAESLLDVILAEKEKHYADQRKNFN